MKTILEALIFVVGVLGIVITIGEADHARNTGQFRKNDILVYVLCGIVAAMILGLISVDVLVV